MATILTEEMVGRDFAARARAFAAATGKPLFEYELDEYRVELHALPQFFGEGPYELSDVNADYPGCLTWRRLADGLDGYTFEELIAEAQEDFEITITPDEYDDDVPVHIVENFLQYFNYFERPEVNAFNELERWFGHPLFERGASIHPASERGNGRGSVTCPTRG